MSTEYQTINGRSYHVTTLYQSIETCSRCGKTITGDRCNSPANAQKSTMRAAFWRGGWSFICLPPNRNPQPVCPDCRRAITEQEPTP